MGQVLVIKNADFSANRVSIVTFDGVPCTGIELDETSIAVTGDQPVTVGYSVTPLNTTDSIIWTSSDTSVATIEGNVVTILGIGTTTITVTCGNYSDSLVLTADLYAQPDWFAANGLTLLPTDGSNNHTLQITSTVPGEGVSFNRIEAAQKAINSDFQIPIFDSNQNYNDAKPIRIPNNVGRIHFSGSGLYNTSSSSSGVAVAFGSATESVNYASLYTVVKGLSLDAIPVSSNTANGSVDVPDGADCFILGTRLKTTTAEGANPEDVASSFGFTIHFLPAATE